MSRSLPTSDAIEQILHFDLASMKAYVAVHDAHADDPAGIHACSIDWALVDSAGGQRGWRRRHCANQLTTCP